VKDLPLVVVMPDGYRSFYTNHHQGPAYARHFGEELPAMIERTFAVRSARYGERFGFRELSDVASMPLLIVLAALVQLAISPVLLACSRHFEHEADRFSLEITQDNHAAATTFIILQQENLGVPRPSRLYKLWRLGHPSLGDRIDFSNDYRPWESTEPLVYGHLFEDP
jgi:hypothetical protein